MNKTVLFLGFALLLATNARGQAKPRPQTPVIVDDYNARALYCKQNAADSVNCTDIKTKDGDLGIARICPAASEKDQSRLTTFSMNLLTLDGLGGGISRRWDGANSRPTKP
jgi:hypothetical protein